MPNVKSQKHQRFRSSNAGKAEVGVSTLYPITLILNITFLDLKNPHFILTIYRGMTKVKGVP